MPRRSPRLFPLATMDKAVAKHMKASFRRADPCVRPPLFSLWRASASCVDAAGTSSMQLHSPTLEDVREEEGLIWLGGGGMGHLGIFVRDMKEHLCWGARSALRIVCAGPVFKGNV